jgi:hypothetical protein
MGLKSSTLKNSCSHGVLGHTIIIKFCWLQIGVPLANLSISIVNAWSSKLKAAKNADGDVFPRA